MTIQNIACIFEYTFFEYAVKMITVNMYYFYNKNTKTNIITRHKKFHDGISAVLAYNMVDSFHIYLQYILNYIYTDSFQHKLYFHNIHPNLIRFFHNVVV